jgi:hypothetical protein
MLPVVTHETVIISVPRDDFEDIVWPGIDVIRPGINKGIQIRT